MKGIVVKYWEDRGYGFIESAQYPYSEVWFHIRDVHYKAKRGVRVGMQVEFELKQAPKGVRAKNIFHQA